MNKKVVVLGDLKAKVRERQADKVTNMYLVSRVNENG